MHKLFSTTIPESVSSYPEEESPCGMFPITYLQKYYSKTLRRQLDGPAFYRLDSDKRLGISQAIIRAFADLHGTHHLHNDFNRDNVFIEKAKDPSGQVTYRARLNDFDLAESLEEPLELEFPLPPNLTKENSCAIRFMLKTPVLDTLSVLYEVYRLVLATLYPSAEAPNAFTVLVSPRKEVHQCFYRSFGGIVRHVKDIVVSKRSLRAASIQMRIGSIFYQTALAAKDLEDQIAQEVALGQELKVVRRSQEQVEELLAKIHADFPTMEEIYHHVAWLVTASYIKEKETWLRYAESEEIGPHLS